MVIKQNQHVKALLGKSLILLLAASPKYRTMQGLRFNGITSWGLCLFYIYQDSRRMALYISCTLPSSPYTCLIRSSSFYSESLKAPLAASRVSLYKIIKIISTKWSFRHDWPHPFYQFHWCPQLKWSAFPSHHVT